MGTLSGYLICNTYLFLSLYIILTSPIYSERLQKTLSVRACGWSTPSCMQPFAFRQFSMCWLMSPHQAANLVRRFSRLSIHRLERLSDEFAGTATMLDSFVVDNDTTKRDHAAVGTYQFMDTTLGIAKHVGLVTVCHTTGLYGRVIRLPSPYWQHQVV